MSEAGPSMRKSGVKTRSDGAVYDPDLGFSPAPKFQPQDQLPSVRSVISLIRYHVEVRHKDREIALKEVTKQIYCKWFADTVFCVSERTIPQNVGN